MSVLFPIPVFNVEGMQFFFEDSLGLDVYFAAQFRTAAIRTCFHEICSYPGSMRVTIAPQLTSP